MKQIKRTTLSLLLSLSATYSTLAQTESPDPYAQESQAERDQRMKWWRDSRFGLFIHWGVYTVPAGSYQGKPVKGIGEHILRYAKIPLTEYKTYASEFNPVNYDPDAWARLAKEAGMKYLVITAKHHDGFALFDSKVSEWDVVDATPYGKDLIAPLAEACKKHGIKLGLYYSQAQDWIQGGSVQGDGPWDPAQNPKETMDDYIRDIAAPQVKEILTNYGPISILWWDTPIDMTQQKATPLIEPLKLQPGIIHNDRLGGGFQGDTKTPEQHIPSDVDAFDWETCMTMNGTWAFKSNDHNWKPTKTLIRNLIDIASKGGNYLLNIGPMADGTIPQPSIERLKEVGAWMKTNGDGIYGTKGSRFARPSWGRITRKDNAQGTQLFLHVFDWKEGSELEIPVKNKPLSASLLGDSSRKLRLSQKSGYFSLKLAGQPTNEHSTTIAIQLVGPEAPSGMNLMRQKEDGSITLHAEQAKFDGAGNWMGIDLTTRSIHSWVADKAYVEWTFEVQKPGSYTMELDIHSHHPQPATLEVSINGAPQHPVVLTKTNGFQATSAGEIKIEKPGPTTIRLTPVSGKWNKANPHLRALRLKP